MKITVQNLTFSYGIHDVLRGVDFTVEEGNMVCVLGKNGAGKSTLFRCVLGLQKGYQGEIRIDGQEVRGLSAGQLAEKMAYIPQNHNTAFAFPVKDMVLLGTTASLGRFENPGKAQRKTALEAMKRIGIEGLAERSYAQISGGEQQLVLIARALAQKARILVMDEPCANLDYGNQIRLLQILRTLAREGYLILQSTHNPEHAFLYANKALALIDGKTEKIGTPKEVLTREVLEKMYQIEMDLYSVGAREMTVCVPKQI